MAELVQSRVETRSSWEQVHQKSVTFTDLDALKKDLLSPRITVALIVLELQVSDEELVRDLHDQASLKPEAVRQSLPLVDVNRKVPQEEKLKDVFQFKLHEEQVYDLYVLEVLGDVIVWLQLLDSLAKQADDRREDKQQDKVGRNQTV